MAGLTIKNETVYVIYHNGQPYQAHGRKLVYTTKGAANGVITSDSEEMARFRFIDKERKSKRWSDWYDLSREKREEMIKKVKDEFEVVEYVPKKVNR